MAESTLPEELQQEAFELERGDLPEVRETARSNPNFAKSEVVHVRLSQNDLAALQCAADGASRTVSDVIRAAVHRYLKEREVSGEVQDLIAALNERGLRIVSDR
jgi:Arc/MetJ-type ribon-helix-helix transcriptional regulator